MNLNFLLNYLFNFLKENNTDILIIRNIYIYIYMNNIKYLKLKNQMLKTIKKLK